MATRATASVRCVAGGDANAQSILEGDALGVLRGDALGVFEGDTRR